MSDLIKRIDAYIELDFMDVSSYGNATVSSGEVKIVKDLNTSVEGRDVLIIEDIIDSGKTLSYLLINEIQKSKFHQNCHSSG